MEHGTKKTLTNMQYNYIHKFKNFTIVHLGILEKNYEKGQPHS